jgi:hypothetical protein
MSFPFPSAATITGATTATATIKNWCPFLRVAARYEITAAGSEQLIDRF